MREDLVKKAVENRRKIEKSFATAKKGMTLTELAEITKLPISTVKRHLEKLVSMGRVHVDSYRGFGVYVWNGKQVYQDRIFLSENHVLFVDAMINPWGNPFVRIKESKRIPGTNDWDTVGAVLVDNKRINELADKLNSIKSKLKEYAEISEPKTNN
jgi:DNA-binding transcriptional ArsR family regulator